jgi:hypothetical protein
MKNEWNIDKFDIIVGNPPYQTQNEGDRKTQPIWHFFVEKSISMLCEGGYLNMVHPSGWRNIDGIFKSTQKLMFSKKITYLEIHDEKDGIKTFGAETRYDFYCLKNTLNNSKTKIKGQDGKVELINLSNVQFLPNGNFNEVYSLVANNNEDKVEVLYSSSTYETRKSYINKTQTDEHIYPILSLVRKNGEIEYIYSSKNIGHFNIPKVVWSNTRITSIGTYIDKDGEFGMTQFCYGIVDKDKNLTNISKALKSKRFTEIMSYCSTGSFPSLNHKILSTLRKDFYKQFLND